MPKALPERTRTDRDQLRLVLERGRPFTLRELSQEAGISEERVLHHVEHLEKSLKREARRLVVEPPECLGCGFVFEGRHRLSRPGKCPECRGTRIGPATLTLSPAEAP